MDQRTSQGAPDFFCHRITEKPENPHTSVSLSAYVQAMSMPRGPRLVLLAAISVLLNDSQSYSVPSQRVCSKQRALALKVRFDRRSFGDACTSAAVASLLPGVALADTNGETLGKSTGTQAPPPDGEAPFAVLPSGVKVKAFRAGEGGETASKGSRVAIQCSGRLLNLNGVNFYNTK